MRLSDEQLAAVEASTERFTVRAAAGSGKTSVLTARFIRHVVDDGFRPDQILTITFTRKAAAEMKARIVRKLRDTGREEDAQTAETGPIQTIHSFCERLLRENALAAGVDPAYEVLDEANRAPMETEAVRTCLARVGDDQPLAAALVTRMAGERRWGTPNRLDAAIAGDVSEVLDRLRGSGLPLAALEARYADVESVLTFWGETILADVDWPEEALEEARARPLDEWLGPVGEALKRDRLRIPAWLKVGVETVRADAAHTAGLVQIALAVWGRLEGEQSRRQQFDFPRLESLAVALAEGTPAVRERLAHQYRAVLVDEAQDVNPMQYRLLRALSLPNEMMVGDPQQSIYAFRMADPDLFVQQTVATECLELRRNFRSQPGILAFVDDLFGHFWGQDYAPMLKPAAAMDLHSDEPPPGYGGVELWTMPLKDSAAVASGIAQLCAEGTPPGDVTVLVRTGNFGQNIETALRALGIAAELVGGVQRFYSRLEVRDLANALEAAADPGRDFALLAFLRGPFVGLSLDAVVDLAHRGRVYERLRELVPSVEGDAERIARFLEWFPPLVAYADRVPAWTVIAALLRDTDYLPEVARRPNGEQSVANVRKLFVLATEQPERGALALAEEIREIQTIKHREGDAPLYDSTADVVRIMTVHKAKGLEFSTVVLADTHDSGAKRWRNHEKVLTDGRTGMVVTKYGTRANPAHAWLRESRAARERAEEFRLLYVGMTRARNRLCVVTSPAGGGAGADSHAGMLAERLLRRDAPPPGVKVRSLGP